MDLKKIAKKKTLKGDVERVITVAAISKGGSILSVGVNDYSRLSYPFKKINRYKERQGLHAELAAIFKCSKKQLKGSTMTVYAETRAGKPLACCKPCPACRRACELTGVKTIKYWENGELKAEKI
jgi:deoxycytidylate deaminase